MKLHHFIPACLLAALLGSAAAAVTAQNIPADILASARASGVIRIANTQSSPPWSLIDDKLQPAGYDVEVAKEVARRIGVAKVVFVADSFKNFVEGLKAGKYDMVMNDLTPSPEREKQVDFAAPYGVEDFRIFVLASNTSIKDKPDLKGKKVGVTTGTTNESWARANLRESDIRAYDNGGFVFNDLGNGRIDAVISSHFGGMKYANVNKLPIKEVGPVLIYQLSAPAMPKGQQPLKEAVSKAIGDMTRDGTIDRLARRWVGAEFDMVGDIQRALQQP
ncbi:transporter substrate-binding domain-containing protein [Herbaspirillum huttiense]|jgi:cystine transport system substrate-binding protein|uniref:transporter substrate-binding domain-containing protein n=1 Tax=Herbaspirillum TaxID=963 RepID=UPI00258E8DDD|nr:transporter substrate-binding domain-containing protein [Herbaspirillum sp.]MCP3653864.1 transporter substrate-binding domain-containing protein [Herbaspirillum sp.]MCP3947203.1 transporter substrate-binding domain-containing protein [Herbaspirillum sp.]MCP4032575.1 transporter substrate-binding domain-containing protein [Herbaspirillum sp.]MCP4555821.1 transporter substrate-binding domain-containing protein [Herbaspirillum sp.]